MSVSISNLFNFSKTLPEPFNTLASKKVKVSSKYGSGTESTLCATVIKAIHAVCNCMMGTGEGAVGSIDHRTVAEYKSAAGTDIYHLVVFDSSSGNIMASVYDKNTETIENYQCHSSARDGAAVMMALVPLLLKDDEFDENFQTYFDQRTAGYPDMKKTTEAMAILCDNAYRRIKDDSCPEHIKVTLDKSGNVLRVSQSHLLAGAYTPTSVLAGEFTIFAQTGNMELGKQIYELRKKANLSQEQLAEKVGVSRQTISKWELGETAPDIKQAQVLSQVFSVSLDELTGNDTKEVIYKKVSNTEKLAGLIIKVIKIWGIIILACLIVAVVGIVLFGFVRGEGSVEFENNVEKVTFTEVVGEESYIITIGSDGYFEGIGMSDEIKEELMELIVVGDLPTSEDNITDYFIKLREGTQQETP